LSEICRRIKREGSFAFDTEFVMEDRFQPEVCVVQLATDKEVAVVDPFVVKDLTPLWSLIGDPEVEVIVHAGMEDLALCQTQGGVTPTRVFDCQIACGLVSTDYPLSLSRMARNVLGVRLHKSQTLTDWRRRPLSPEQIRYAADDVVYLPAIRKELGKQLAKLNRTHWAEEEMAKFHAVETYARAIGDNILKLKGAGALDGRGLAVARELVKTRDELAARMNRPARAVLRDHLIIEIAKHRWTKFSEIKTLRGLNLRAQSIQALADAATRASRIPKEELPVPTPPCDETDQEAAMALLVGAVIRGYCAEHGIAHQLVGSKKELRDYVRSLVRSPDEDDGLSLRRGWRHESIGTIIWRLMHGQANVRLERRKDGIAVVVD
jgi:ribonuclease D